MTLRFAAETRAVPTCESPDRKDRRGRRDIKPAIRGGFQQMETADTAYVFVGHELGRAKIQIQPDPPTPLFVLQDDPVLLDIDHHRLCLFVSVDLERD